MLLLYPAFYRRFGVIRTRQFVEPRVFPKEVFHFPRESVLHWLSDNDVEFPNPNDIIFADFVSTKIMMDHYFLLESYLGGPIKLPFRPIPLIRQYHAKNRSFKWLRDVITKNQNQMYLDVINYNLLRFGYRYIEKPINKYYEWYNIHKTCWLKIGQLTKDNNKNHFFIIDLPDQLPGLVSLRKFENLINIAFIKAFDNTGRRYILELWKWINPSLRSQSLLSSVSEENINKVNIIFRYKDVWSIINLGILNSAIEGAGGDDIPNVVRMDYTIIQKYFIRFCLRIQTAQTENDNISELEIHEKSEGLTSDINPYQNNNNNNNNKVGEIEEVEDDVLIKKTDNILDIKTVDDDLALLDKIDIKYVSSKEIDEDEIIDETLLEKEEDLNDVNILNTSTEIKITEEEKNKVNQLIFERKSVEDVVDDNIEYLSDKGIIPTSEYKGLKNLLNKYNSLKDPDNNSVLLKDIIDVKEKDITIDEINSKLPDSDTVLDKSLLESRLLTYDKKYINEVMERHIKAMPVSLMRAGMIVQDYTTREETSILGDSVIHTIRIKPIDGAASTLHMRIPKVDNNGEFKIAGNKYRMVKQRADTPIRKTKPDQVALTSNYGKLFINRSDKKINDLSDWINRYILSEGLSGESELIFNVIPKNVFNNKQKYPKYFTGLAQAFSGFETKEFYFDFENPEGDETLVRCGFEKKTKTPIYLSAKGLIYLKGNKTPINDIFTCIGLDQSKAPVDFSTLTVFSKNIPLVLVLGYLLGINKLITFLDVPVKKFKRGTRYLKSNSSHEIESKPNNTQVIAADEVMLRFKDYDIVYSRNNEKASLILSGFKEVKNYIKDISYDEFNRKDAYFSILDNLGLNSIYIREIELMDQLFVDPITELLLKKIKEPLTFKGLLIRSNELLTTDDHPDLTDMNYMLIRGYDRFAGLAYKELVQSVREHKMKNIRGKTGVSLNPYSVWNRITKDNTIRMVQEINPIDNLKQIESVTYVGEGGRNKDTLNINTRVYHESDMGVISEATVDSSDVAVNTYLSANPLFTSLLGTTERYDKNNPKYSSLVSTSMLSSVAAENDDPKRVNFIQIQQSHTVSCDGYTQPLIRTGMEEVMAKRVGDAFAYSAEEDGKVISIDNKHGIIVEYVNGNKHGVNLGRRYGHAGGSTFPHDIVTPLKLNQKFKRGDIIAYNNGFFEPDWFEPNKIIWKSSYIAKTAIMESEQTFEDSSAISNKLANKLRSKITEVRSIVVEFGQGIRDMVKINTEVSPNDFLCLIEDQITNEVGLFDEKSIELLKRLSNKAPRAKVKGIVDRIEVLYHGEKSDMSDSLKKLADESDRFLSLQAKHANRRIINGSVDNEYKVEGTPLALNNAEIKVYITTAPLSGVGDKIVVSNQMKSVTGDVMDYPVVAEDNEEIEVIFGERSLLNRIVESPRVIGTTNSLLIHLSKLASKMYLG